MFERRNKPHPVSRIRDFFWPRSGWHRASKYVFHRVARLPGTPYSLAAGFACGAAISFTPFVGLHFVLSALLAWAIRANVIASAIGTAVGNPWTFPFIWVWIYQFGLWLTTVEGAHPATIDFASLFAEMMEALLRLDLRFIFDSAWPVFWPMLAGSIPTALVVWAVFYLGLNPVIASYQGRRARRRAGLE
jgi:uncharacterized protein (DUF2062 family)